MELFNKIVIYLCSIVLFGFYAQSYSLKVSPFLEECYRTTELQERLPMTMTMLIELIRKIEDTPGYKTDIRQLSNTLLNRFRQDGIEKLPRTTQTIPFASTGFQFSKYNFILNRLLPRNANGTFLNDTLTVIERCSLHFMLSSSFNFKVHHNEISVCNKENSNINHKRSAEYEDEIEFDISPIRHIVIDQVSECPIENGIVYTNWGTISASNLIAGIATGLQSQQIPIGNIVDLNQLEESKHNLFIDNRFGSTLAGDLAEVAIFQGPHDRPIIVGTLGQWNSTVNPKWYFLSKNRNLEMTDAEIRGDIDGLILAMNIQTLIQEKPELKLSELLNMYYSSDSVLSLNIKACNRKDLFETLTSIDQLKIQTNAFAIALFNEMRSPLTITAEGFRIFTGIAVDAFYEYISQMTDFSCKTVK